MHQVILQRVYF